MIFIELIWWHKHIINKKLKLSWAEYKYINYDSSSCIKTGPFYKYSTTPIPKNVFLDSETHWKEQTLRVLVHF